MNAKLVNAKLVNAKLVNAKLVNAKLVNAKLVNAKLVNAKLAGGLLLLAGAFAVVWTVTAQEPGKKANQEATPAPARVQPAPEKKATVEREEKRAPKSKEEIEREASVWMKQKLTNSEKILEGLSRGDMDLVNKHASAMRALNRVEYFVRREPAAYRTHLHQFQFTLDELVRTSEDGNLDGATLAFTQMTICCVNCHKHLRRM